LRPWAEQNGWDRVDEFCEAAVSGFKVSADNRDALVKIKAMAQRKEFDILGIYMSDRLGRIAHETPLVVSFLNDHGVKVVSYSEGEIANQSHNDSLFCFLRFWQAEGESRKTQMRVRDATIDSVKMGRWRGGSPPYGYRAVNKGSLNGKGRPIFDIEIDPEKAEVVRTMFNLYAKEHYGSHGVARYLNDRDIPTSTGVMWCNQKVLKILRNRLYTGIYELYKKDKKKPSTFSPLMPHLVILEQEVFDEAQKKLGEFADKFKKRRVTQHGSLLFNGLLYCGVCGKKMTTHRVAQPRARKDGTPHTYYCSQYRCGSFRTPSIRKATCNLKNVRTEEVEREVVTYAKQFIRELDKDEILASHKNDAQTRLDEAKGLLAKAEQDLAKKDKEIVKLKEEIMKTLMGEGNYSHDIIKEMLATKEGEREGLVARVSELQLAVDSLEEEIASQAEFNEELEDWEKKFDAADTVVKKAMLINIIDRITILGTKVRVRFRLKVLHAEMLKSLRAFEPLVWGCVPPDYIVEREGDTVRVTHPTPLCATQNEHAGAIRVDESVNYPIFTPFSTQKSVQWCPQDNLNN